MWLWKGFLCQIVIAVSRDSWVMVGCMAAVALSPVYSLKEDAVVCRVMPMYLKAFTVSSGFPLRVRIPYLFCLPSGTPSVVFSVR